MASILSRYILRETVGTWLAVTAVLLVILLTNQLAGVLERAAEGGFPRSVVLTLVGLGLLQNASLVLPVALMLGVMLSFGRLYHDSEMTAAIACGAEPRRLFRPIMGLAVLVALIVGWIALVTAPSANSRVQLLRSSAAQTGEFAPLTPGRFRNFGGRDTVLYAAAAGEDGSLERVFLKRTRGDRYEIALAARARHEVSADGALHTLTLYDGERFEGIPGSAEFRRVRFAENVIPVRIPPLTPSRRSVESVPSAALWSSSDPEWRAELHYRLALPVMVFVLTWLAVPMSKLRPRQGRYARVWIAIIVCFVYLSMVSTGRVWLAKGTVPGVFGLWWVHAGIAGGVWALLRAPETWAQWRSRRTERAPT